MSDDTLFRHVLNIQHFSGWHLIKSYLATFKKYVEFMTEHGYMPADVATSILQTIKQDRETMIHAAVTYYDEPEEDQSPEAFRAQLYDLEARWAALAREDGGAVDKPAPAQKKRRPGESARGKR